MLFCKRLEENKLVFSNETRAVFLLLGLPRTKYGSLIRSIHSADGLNLQNVKNKLMLEERTEKFQMGRDKDEANALATRVGRLDRNDREWRGNKGYDNRKDDEKSFGSKRNGSKPTRREDQERSVLCFACKEPNYIARYCQNVKRLQNGMQGGQQWYGNEPPWQHEYSSSPSPQNLHGRAHTAEVHELSKGKKEKGERVKSGSSTVRYKALSVKENDENKGVWLIDSGSSHHMTLQNSIFSEFFDVEEEIEIADGEYISVAGW
ncbi:hypothetical protein PR048_010908 [Dryococelus australis]|uniref:Retrovirus-related Pol polyprotein from transposon TNT 1-94-like beta-barrel domain-containing protein n=1 Tax=Dryococelus australis TaxID=614101 RepID=A0ABQ9I420_9NEOP|nr:hypothetical protein PR048_010908 [Dryococelus australis]